MVSPLIATLLGDARKATRKAISVASTTRPMLTDALSLVSAAGSIVRSVRVVPGWIATTLIPWGPSSSAKFFVSEETAALRSEAM
jgi:hypothetical protein